MPLIWTPSSLSGSISAVTIIAGGIPLRSPALPGSRRKSSGSVAKQLSEALRLSEAVVHAVLDKTVEQGLVEAFGVGRGRNYMLSHILYVEKARTAGYVRQRDIDESRYEELILNLARANEYISRADVVNLLHVKPAKAYGLLSALAAAGKLEPVNKGHYAKYKLKTQ